MANDYYSTSTFQIKGDSFPQHDNVDDAYNFNLSILNSSAFDVVIIDPSNRRFTIPKSRNTMSFGPDGSCFKICRYVVKNTEVVRARMSGVDARVSVEKFAITSTTLASVPGIFIPEIGILVVEASRIKENTCHPYSKEAKIKFSEQLMRIMHENSTIPTFNISINDPTIKSEYMYVCVHGIITRFPIRKFDHKEREFSISYFDPHDERYKTFEIDLDTIYKSKGKIDVNISGYVNTWFISDSFEEVSRAHLLSINESKNCFTVKEVQKEIEKSEEVLKEKLANITSKYNDLKNEYKDKISEYKDKSSRELADMDSQYKNKIRDLETKIFDLKRELVEKERDNANLKKERDEFRERERIEKLRELERREKQAADIQNMAKIIAAVSTVACALIAIYVKWKQK